MAFHIGNLGSAGRHVARFADVDGYVPERGDPMGALDYPGGWEMDEGEWADFVAEAVTATNVAQAEIDEFNGVER